MPWKQKRALALVVLFAFAGCYSAARKYEKDPPLAQYEGTLSMSGLQKEVNVYRDERGVPHIFADNERDLFYAVGYVQAQDRLWEMTLLRAIAEGRLSEIFGDLGVPGQGISGFSLRTFEMDKRQRIMGLKWVGEMGEAMLREVDRENYDLLNAYCEGANEYIRTHESWDELPLEFQVLRLKPEPFRVADLASLGAFIGSMLAANMDLELLRYGLFEKYGPELGWKLLPLHYSPGPTIVPPEILRNGLDSPRDLPPGGAPSSEELGYDLPLSADAAFDLLLADSAIKSFFHHDYPLASNNWVVSGKLTEKGSPILCNDPHLAHIEPSLFYMMRIKGGKFDCYGVAFPLSPYPVLGHTRKLSWGATTTAADVQDLFIETTSPDRPGMYRYKGQWLPFTVREEIIKVRVGSRTQNRVVKIRHSVHGPIINDIAGKLPRGTPPIAMRWTGWDFDTNLEVFHAAVSSKSVEEFMVKFRTIPRENVKIRHFAAMYNKLCAAESVDDFIEAMDLLVVPNQSWVAADADGRIAYVPGGLVPIRKKGLGVMPAPGETGEYDWTGFIPVNELPMAVNPERGFMVTANNEVVDAEWYPYVFATNYGDGWRAWRIEELIDELKPLDVDDMVRIQNDVLVKRAEWEVPYILKAVEAKSPDDELVLKAAEELRNWDFMADHDATAPSIFFTFIKELRRNTLEDEMPARDYKAFLAGGRLDDAVTMWVEAGESPFFDDKRTGDVVEDANDIIVKSLHDAMKKVEKKYGKDPSSREWGKLHTIKWYHPLGWGPLSELSVGPYPHLGADQTVRNASTAGFGKNPWKTMGGPVLRHIMDMGDPDNALMIIDGSESGQWLSPHYRDMHEMYVNGEYVTATMDPERVKAEAAYHLTLEPN